MKTQFRLERGVSNRKTGAFFYQEVVFNSNLFNYAGSKKNSKDGEIVNVSNEKFAVYKDYNQFRKMILQADFFFASDGDMVDYYNEPEDNWNVQYSVDFIWIFNNRIYTTFQLLDDTYYCLDYKARERFEPLLEFLHQLGEGDGN